ncbi:MFS transporter [Granulicella sp. dw_53]|uniref:MFS transporter n=1 Tax=Granulicella sp. dw_53 TaxID=2719792 RepID=UPI001BD33652|nr:MFS transporter [Granulicella sp. dw_53]
MSEHHQSNSSIIIETSILMLTVGVVGSNGLMLSPILSDVAHSLHANTLSIARVISSYGGGTAASALFLAPLIDRIGAKRSLLLGAAALFVATLASAFATHPYLLAAAQLLAGLGAGLILPSCYAMATVIAKPGEEARSLGRVLIGWSLSLVAGIPISALIAQRFGWRFSYLALAACAALAAVGIWQLPNQAPATEPTRRRTNILAPLRYPGVAVGLALCLACTGAFYGVYAFLGDQVRHTLGISAGKAGIIVLTYGIGFGLGAIANRFVDRIGTRVLFPLAFLGSAVVYVLMAFSTHNFTAILTVAVLWGIAAHLCLNMIVLLLSRARPTERGAILGLNSATTYLGAMFGTALAGAIYTRAGFKTLSLVAAGLQILAAALLKLVPPQPTPLPN